MLKVASCILAGLAISGAMVYLRGPALYRSVAALRYTAGDLPPDIVPAPAFPSSMFINPSAQNVLSRSSLTNLIHTYGLYYEEQRIRPMEDIVEQMRRRITFRNRDEDIVEVAFEYSDPARAQKVVDHLASGVAAEGARARINLSYFNEQFFREMTALAARDWDTQTASARTGHRAKLDLELARQHYLALQRKHSSARLIRTLDEKKMGSRLEVAETASYNGKAQQENTAIFAAGALCGLIVGVLVAARKLPRLARIRLQGVFVRKGMIRVLVYGVAGFLFAACSAIFVMKYRTYPSVAFLRVVPTTMPLQLAEGNTTEQGAELLRESSKLALSRGNLINLINSHSLYRAFQETTDEKVNRMRDAIRLESVEGSELRVEYRYPTPWIAQQVAQRMVSSLIYHVHEYRKNAARSTVRFLEEELRLAAEAWDNADRLDVSAERRALDIEFARNHYIALKEKLYRAKLTEALDQRQQGGMIQLLNPASLPVEEDYTAPILSAGAIAGLLLGLFKRARALSSKASPSQ